jgi:hypothetical protein
MRFMDEHVYPYEETFEEPLEAVETGWTVPDHGGAKREGRASRVLTAWQQ